MAKISLVNCNGEGKKSDPTKRQLTIYMSDHELDLMQRWGYRLHSQGSGHRARLAWNERRRWFEVTHELGEDGASITLVPDLVDHRVALRFGVRRDALGTLPNFGAIEVDLTRVNGVVILELPAVNDLPVPDYKVVRGHPLDAWQRAELDFVRRWALLGSWPLFPRHLLKHLPPEAKLHCQQGNFAAARQVVVARKQLVKVSPASADKTIAGVLAAGHTP